MNMQQTVDMLCVFQDLIGASVVLQQDGSCIGTVLDIYDGTGSTVSQANNIYLLRL